MDDAPGMKIPHRVHMVGAGGIGMSALAQMLVSRGHVVSGSDRCESPTTMLLEKKGIRVTIGHGNVPEGTELLIYSDAVWPDNPERSQTAYLKIPEMSYFEALGEISNGMRTVAVAGTHGKTTTTGMVAKILVDAGAKPSAVIGSIVRDFESNYVQGESDLFVAPSSAKATAGKGGLFVVEACEYRDHLLELSSEILVITNVELDHTDFFPTLAAMQETFRKAAEAVPKHGAIITNPQGPNMAPVLQNVQARLIDYTQMAIGSLQLPGEFNKENARAALAAARVAMPTLSLEAGVKSLSQFKGSWRRFEYKGETESGALIYDDYAHHPTAVQKTIVAAREKFPDKKIVVAFHPHLYSRTRDLMEGFSSALATADEVILAPIFEARERPIEGVTSEVLAEKIAELGTPVQAFKSLHDIFLHLTKPDTLVANDLLLTMGAGDIYKVAEEIVSE